MKNYELLYIVSAQFTEEELESIKNEINQLIEKYGGQIGYQDLLGKKKLAYPIDKVVHGYYILTEFELEDGSVIKDINQAIKLNKKINRGQIIAKTKISDKEIEKKKQRAFKPIDKSPYQSRPEKKPTTSPKPGSEKISREKLDEKLDEILKSDNII